MYCSITYFVASNLQVTLILIGAPWCPSSSSNISSLLQSNVVSDWKASHWEDRTYLVLAPFGPQHFVLSRTLSSWSSCSSSMKAVTSLMSSHLVQSAIRSELATSSIPTGMPFKKIEHLFCCFFWAFFDTYRCVLGPVGGYHSPELFRGLLACRAGNKYRKKYRKRALGCC